MKFFFSHEEILLGLFGYQNNQQCSCLSLEKSVLFNTRMVSKSRISCMVVNFRAQLAKFEGFISQNPKTISCSKRFPV